MLVARDAQLSTHLSPFFGGRGRGVSWAAFAPVILSRPEQAAPGPKEAQLRAAPLKLRAARAHCLFKWTNKRAMGGPSRANKQRGHCGVCGGPSGFKRLRAGPSVLTRRR